jgi:dihydrofolate synthase/folylpolyglutamate synthase
MIKTYDEAVTFLREYIPFTLYNTDAYNGSTSLTTGKTETHDPLDRMRVFLQLLNNPEKKFASVLIGGTSGKGSTSYLISHLLTAAGYKTGLTLSPHIVRINERIQLNEKEITNDEFVSLLNAVLPAVEKMKTTEVGSPSYFEISIGMAFVYFAQKKVDIAVVEVGMGGMYDATNTLEPLIAVLTNVSLDHTQFLGNTVEEIAKTKVGIIKNYELNIKNKKLKPITITAVTQPSVVAIVENRCKEMGVKLLRLRKDFQMTDYTLGLIANYQKENASLAVEVSKQLGEFGFEITEQTIKEALQTTTFGGRFEIKEYKKQTVILDGAHNQAKMHAFVDSLKKAYPSQKKLFVIAFKRDKHIEEMVKEITDVADSIIVTEFSIGTDTMISNASMTSEEIAAMIKKFDYSKDLFIEDDCVNALEKALVLAQKDDIISITGSLYLVGEIKQRLQFD